MGGEFGYQFGNQLGRLGSDNVHRVKGRTTQPQKQGSQGGGAGSGHTIWEVTFHLFLKKNESINYLKPFMGPRASKKKFCSQVGHSNNSSWPGVTTVASDGTSWAIRSPRPRIDARFSEASLYYLFGPREVCGLEWSPNEERAWTETWTPLRGWVFVSQRGLSHISLGIKII